MDEIDNAYKHADELKMRRKTFSRIGWALFTALTVATILQLVGLTLTRIFYPQLENTSWFSDLLNFIPMYIIAFPLAYLILKPIPVGRPTEYKISFKKLMEFLLMCFCLMYIGSFIGNAISLLISGAKGSNFENPLIKILESSNLYLNFLFIVLIAPVMEELVFRKLLIDRVRIYGESTAILVSGLAFGLFHGNLFQFFYAFGIGSMFAYIYLRTGRIRYTMILHSIINFFGGILPIILTKYANLNAISQLNGSDTQNVINFAQNNLWQMIAVAVYSFAIIAAFIGGLALLIDKRKKILLLPAEKQLEKGTGFKTIFINVGMLLFVLITLGLMAYTAMVV